MSTSSSDAPTDAPIGIPPDALFPYQFTKDDEDLNVLIHADIDDTSGKSKVFDFASRSSACALMCILPSVIKNDGRLDKNLSAITLLALVDEMPWIVELLWTAYESRNYHPIRCIKRLHSSSQPTTWHRPESNIEPSIMTATLRSWNAKFVGNSDALLELILKDSMKVADHYARYITHLQSSGTGKSRTHDELAKRILYIPLNLASETAHSYPPGDPQVRGWFDVVRDFSGPVSLEMFQARCNAFLQALFHQTWDELVKITREHSSALDDISMGSADSAEQRAEQRVCLLASAFRNNMAEGGTFEAHGPYRSTFYDGVIEKANRNLSAMPPTKQSSRSPTSKNPGGQEMIITVAKEVIRILDPKALCNEGPLVVMCWDEAHSLVTEVDVNGTETRFSKLQRSISKIRRLPIFSVFISTAGNFHPPNPDIRYEPSNRITILVPHAFPPITEVGFDDFAFKVDSTGSSTLAYLASTYHMAHLGRALFPTRYDNGNKPIKEFIVHFAQEKLLNRKPRGDLTDAEKLACLAVRLGLDFRAEREAERTQVERHMRLCIAATSSLQDMVTVSPSEPLLAEAAYMTMGNYFRAGEAASALLKHIDTSYLKAGDRGEVIAALLLLLARDNAVTNINRKKPFPAEIPLPRNTLKNNGARKGRIVTVLEFLDALLPSDVREDVRKQKPSHSTLGASELKLEDAFASGYIWFNHFVKVYDTKMVNRQYLWQLISRGAAAICVDYHCGIDVLIPILFGDRLKPDCVSAILVHVKNSRKFTNTVTEHVFAAMDPFDVGLFSMGEAAPFPVIRLVFALASKESAVMLDVPSEERLSQCESGPFTAYDIWVAGATHQSFGVIHKSDCGTYRELLERSRKTFEGYDMGKSANPSQQQVSRAHARRGMHPAVDSKPEHYEKFISSVPVKPMDDCEFDGSDNGKMDIDSMAVV